MQARHPAVRPPLTPPRASGQVHWSIPITVVTPMFGGGHTAGQIDDVTPISAKSIRGHLRFWWRWLIGQKIAKQAIESGRDGILEMSLRESEVFGNTAQSSPFDLVVSDVKPAGSPHRELNSPPGPYEFEGGSPELYALFSAKNNNVQRLWREGLTFSLTIRWQNQRVIESRIRALAKERAEQLRQQVIPEWVAKLALLTEPEIQEQLRLALWGWLNFGGVGSRTRRGLGAVWAASEQLQTLTEGCQIGELNLPIVLKKSATDAKAAWHDAIQLLRDFRQAEPRPTKRQKTTVGYNGIAGQTFPKPLGEVAGRSKLPEPDSVRLMTGKHLKQKEHTLQNAENPGDTVTFPEHAPRCKEPLFPRAMFGLPLITHFADGPGTAMSKAGIADSDLDPAQSQLQPVILDAEKGALTIGDRMASPLLVRPLWINNAWHAGFVFIRTPETDNFSAHLQSSQLKPKYRTVPNVPHDQIAGAAVQRLPDLRGKLDILEAFISRAMSAGYRPHTNWERP